MGGKMSNQSEFSGGGRVAELARIYREDGGNIISVLQKMQEMYGYIPEDAVFRLADEIGFPASRIFGVATFYAQFHLKPRGKHIITVCCGTACHVRGSDKIVSALRMELGLGESEDTTQDASHTLEQLACLGTCSLAPVMVCDGKMTGKMTPGRAREAVRNIKGWGGTLG